MQDTLHCSTTLHHRVTFRCMDYGKGPIYSSADGVWTVSTCRYYGWGCFNRRAWVFLSLVLLGWFLVVHVLMILQRQKTRTFCLFWPQDPIEECSPVEQPNVPILRINSNKKWEAPILRINSSRNKVSGCGGMGEAPTMENGGRRIVPSRSWAFIWALWQRSHSLHAELLVEDSQNAMESGVWKVSKLDTLLVNLGQQR